MQNLERNAEISLTTKQIISITTLLLFYLFSAGQDSLSKTFFQTNSKAHLYYVDLKYSAAYVYEIGSYLDKAGTGYSIRNTDTLTRQPANNYVGKATKLINENNKSYLITELKKTKTFLLDPVKNLEVVNSNLNNAYYLDNYFKMSDELNKTYPLNHHSFRNGFSTWEKLLNKEVDYLQFREFAIKQLKEIKDSIGYLQERYTKLTNYVIQNAGTIAYDTLKDSLMKLPADYRSLSGYYGTIINVVAKQRPGYFFKLAEDFPNNRGLIFSAVEDNKEVVQGLKYVDGHNEIKKELFKDRSFGRTMPYRILGTYIIIGGLLTWLILSQK